jgi:hypothetical protein
MARWIRSMSMPPSARPQRRRVEEHHAADVHVAARILEPDERGVLRAQAFIEGHGCFLIRSRDRRRLRRPSRRSATRCAASRVTAVENQHASDVPGERGAGAFDEHRCRLVATGRTLPAEADLDELVVGERAIHLAHHRVSEPALADDHHGAQRMRQPRR